MSKTNPESPWLKAEVVRSEERVKLIRKDVLDYLRMHEFTDEMLHKYPVTVILPGGESWVEAIVFIGYENVEISDIKSIKKSPDYKDGVMFTVKTELDKKEDVLKRDVYIADKPETVYNLEHGPNQPVGIRETTRGGSSGTQDKSQIWESNYLNEPPKQPHIPKGILLNVSDKFNNESSKVGNRRDYFGGSRFIITKTASAPIKS